ncbi:3-methyl-2-oxobutanoate hydroxymethyltransferase [Formicincola oecophyllae]|uniref:3-methyl-2-oxobutanoate hydroxymethyltransferase n=1 Tax=Formicincola oecophyllae TaxID=2558361 RepID=A0A4Y6UAS6_9PROT|nr:3-methyl-2-oxobutanoate hydroxymethyltransferase [Formicincola oecophyllae]QDH13566.1 3-methyl-2-oxobutanoate hydroxymethyltransferase [Formicincola oecophyllae]
MSSYLETPKRTTLAALRKMKAEGRKITMVTTYDYPSAVLADRAGLPLVLVGDSVGMVVQGHDSTLPVTVDEMVYHTRMVARGAGRAMVIADLPFMAYANMEEGLRNAHRLMAEGGAQAIKMEGGAEMAPLVRRLTDNGIPVMAHIGLRPQSQHQMGLRVQARDEAGIKALMADARAHEAAGAFGLLLECIPAEVAQEVTRRFSPVTIGIGAGSGCDGQVQVWHDLLGVYGTKPFKHAKCYADVGSVTQAALEAYRHEVETGSFPAEANTTHVDPAVVTSQG